MKVFITGAKGFIGREVLRAAPKGVVFLSLVRSPSGLNAPGVKEVVGDLENPSSYEKDLVTFSPDVCLHLAWDGLPNHSDSLCLKNLEMTISMLRLLIKHRVPRFISTGSCLEFGLAGSGMVSNEPTRDQVPLFGIIKQSIHEVVKRIDSENSFFSYVWLRIFYSYGYGQHSGALIPSLVQQAQKNGYVSPRCPAAAHDFIHVEDVARVILSIILNTEIKGSLNVGSGVLSTVENISMIVARVLGVGLYKYSSDFLGPPAIWADRDRLTSTVGFFPLIGLEQGVTKTINAYVNSDRNKS